MCCITTIALVIASRVAIFVWWLADPQRFGQAFQNWHIPGLLIPAWLWTLVGAIILPWTTLAYVYVFPDGITGIEWLILGVALLVDLAGHGGGYRHRNRIRTFRRRQAY